MSTSDLSAPFLGRYELVSSENYDEFLKAIKVGMVERTLQGKDKPALEISVSGERWTIKRLSTFRNTEFSFIPGEVFDEVLPDGRIFRSSVSVDGNRLIHRQNLGDVEAVTVSVFGPTEMKQTYTSGVVTAVRVFKRVA